MAQWINCFLLLANEIVNHSVGAAIGIDRSCAIGHQVIGVLRQVAQWVSHALQPPIREIGAAGCAASRINFLIQQMIGRIAVDDGRCRIRDRDIHEVASTVVAIDI